MPPDDVDAIATLSLAREERNCARARVARAKKELSDAFESLSYAEEKVHLAATLGRGTD